MQTPTSLDSTLLTVVLAILAIGLPILIVLAVRLMWNRSLHLGRSKELEKLIWQLHRIASAMEHQMNLSFPAVQPGTEEAADIAFLERPGNPPPPRPAQHAAAPIAANQLPVAPPAASPAPASVGPVEANSAQPAPAPAAANAAPQQQPAASPEQPAEQQPDFPPLVPHDPSKPPRQGGVNSMFGF